MQKKKKYLIKCDTTDDKNPQQTRNGRAWSYSDKDVIDCINGLTSSPLLYHTLCHVTLRCPSTMGKITVDSGLSHMTHFGHIWP